MKLRALQEKIRSLELTVQYLREQGLVSISQSNDIEKNEKSSDGEEYVCYKRTCKTSRSIRHGSFFSSSKLELNQIILLLHLWSKIYIQKLLWKISNSRSKL
ncbi:LOW QUALITY PROTEIN: hypothetical protein HZS_4321 [Henneguya salminicola]|nr:LOW QUALITY PROTEIN: hypothetical protein HZS_4321 [Henneguya salminicola]